MSATAAFPKLYVAEEDLKERYTNKRKGLNRLQAYVKSVENSRKMKIDVSIKKRGIVEFVFHVTQGSSEEAKQDVQGEVCSTNAAKKYNNPPTFLPSAHIQDTHASTEARAEMPAGKQQRMQNEGKPLTIEALEEHERKQTSGPCKLRQFGCGICQHSWWRTVLKSKPVSRCRGGACGNTRYDALPREKEFGIGRFICPNENCKREFFGYCEATEELQCRKCGEFAKPYIHPKWKKMLKRKPGLNPNAKSFKPSRSRQPPKQPEALAPHRYVYRGQGSGPEFYTPQSQGANLYSATRTFENKFSELSVSNNSGAKPKPKGGADKQPIAKIPAKDTNSGAKPKPTGGADKDDRQQVPLQPKIPPRRRGLIFNASKPHQSEGDTMSTFLSQVDFEEEPEPGEGVYLDYESDDNDEEKVGICKFECLECAHVYTVKVRMQDTAVCYKCSLLNRPLTWMPPGDGPTNPANKHSCSRCNGAPNCPNLRKM